MTDRKGMTDKNGYELKNLNVTPAKAGVPYSKQKNRGTRRTLRCQLCEIPACAGMTDKGGKNLKNLNVNPTAFITSVTPAKAGVPYSRQRNHGAHRTLRCQLCEIPACAGMTDRKGMTDKNGYELKNLNVTPAKAGVPYSKQKNRGTRRTLRCQLCEIPACAGMTDKGGNDR